MKIHILRAILTLSLFSFNAVAQKKATTEEVKVTIDLNQVKDDKVMVTVTPPKFSSNEVVYHIPKTVPGTYSTDNYGKLVDDLKAFDAKGKELATTKTDDNSWKISNSNKLSKITYWVNDTYDTEKGGGFGKEDIFSPAGSNILEGKNFMLNNHCFVGYFEGKTEINYVLTV
jgi:predicted metalloprotease with PDZ domain